MQSRKQNHNNQDIKTIKSIVFYSFAREMACFFEIGDALYKSFGVYIFKEPKSFFQRQ
jgi:hypothetical protein